MLDDIWAQTALKLSSELNEVWFWSNFELQDWKPLLCDVYFWILNKIRKIALRKELKESWNLYICRMEGIITGNKIYTVVTHPVYGKTLSPLRYVAK